MECRAGRMTGSAATRIMLSVAGRWRRRIRGRINKSEGIGQERSDRHGSQVACSRRYAPLFHRSHPLLRRCLAPMSDRRSDPRRRRTRIIARSHLLAAACPHSRHQREPWRPLHTMKRLRSTAVVETAAEETGGRTATDDIHESAGYQRAARYREIQGRTRCAPVSHDSICQNISFSANWSCREVPFVWVITPAEGLMSLPLKTISFGYEKLA